MLPTKEEALQELKLAGLMNPGPWTKHSENVGIAARNIAHMIDGLDEDKAYILGLMHDIGRRVGIVDIPTHIYEGYKYCMKKGWDEAAKICMTHSYLQMKDEFNYDPESDTEKEIKKFILNCEADDYDRLIQLCDSLAVDYGFVILEKRFVDVTRRYGIMEDYIKGWEIAFDIKEEFEARMGCSIYDVLPDIGKTTLLTPKPWKPPVPEYYELIETERLTMRRLMPSDYKAMAAWDMDERVYKYLLGTACKSPEDPLVWLPKKDPTSKINILMLVSAKEDGHAVGIYALNHDVERDVWTLSYVNRYDDWGKGYTVEGMKALMNHAADVYEARAFEGECAKENVGSRKVMEKLGMTYDHSSSYTKSDGSATFESDIFCMTIG